MLFDKRGFDNDTELFIEGRFRVFSACGDFSRSTALLKISLPFSFSVLGSFSNSVEPLLVLKLSECLLLWKSTSNMFCLAIVDVVWFEKLFFSIEFGSL